MATAPGHRRRFLARSALAAAVALVLSLLALRVARRGPREVAGELPHDGFTRVAGVVHVHTTLSDGGGPPEEVMAAAQGAGLQFVAITDHNNLDAKRLEGYRQRVLVLVGTELSTSAGHILALGLPDPVFRFSGEPLDALEDVRDLGGASFAAHPLSAREDLRWTGWDLPGPWGIELLNGDSEWRRAGWPRLLRTVGLYALNKPYALLGSLNPPDAVLTRWDGMLQERDVVGIAGTDAHSRLPLTKRLSLRFPSYGSLFSVLQNHVLLPAPLSGDVGADERAVLHALARGRFYIGLDAFAPAGEFSFVVEGRGKRWTMGDHVPVGPGLKLRAGGRVPQGATLTLLRDGKPLIEVAGPVDVDLPGPGVYRVEVRVPGFRVPWILTNPIYVFDAQAFELRARRAAWPPAEAAPAPALILDGFEGRTIFRPEFDPSSAVEASGVEVGAGPDGSAAGRLAFRLGAPGPGRPHTWCALVNREARDLSGRHGLVFAIKGDGVYRLQVHVRDENPASADEGTEWWFASVRTSTEWRRVMLPFSRFRSINPRTDGRLDLDKVRQLVFVLEPATVKPGTAGTIWLDDVGVY